LRPDPFFSVFLAQRLLAKGKLKKVALTAAMRKLIIILNTLVQTDQLWQDPATAQTKTAL